MFKDLKVIELANVLAGPMVGMFFSELNAKVIKVENKNTGGDMTRNWKLPSENSENTISAYYSSVNYNKEIVFLDFNNNEDKNTIYNLIKTADIVITNFKPGAAEKLGMDYKTISAFNPKIIYSHLSGFGPNSDRPAFDLVLQAETGFMSMNGQPDSPPTKMPVALIDVLTAHQLKEGILTALWNREKTGKGAYVETSLFDSAIASLVNQSTNWLMANHIPQRSGSLHPNIAPYGEIFKTNDGVEFTLAIGTEQHFKSLFNLLDLNSEIENPLFTNNTARVKNRKFLSEKLQNAINNFYSVELFDAFSTQKIPFGIIKNIKQVFENETIQELILEEKIENTLTKRPKTVAFKIKTN